MDGVERRALNEDIFREMNERLEQIGEEFGEENVDFVCECADPACSESLSLPPSVYDAVRARATRFVMVPGHQRADLERVIEEHPDYVIVEKVGEAGEVAEDADRDEPGT